MAKQIPKKIIKKCEKIKDLVIKAFIETSNVEDWCEENGIDTNSDEFREKTGLLSSEDMGMSYFVTNIDMLQELLDKANEKKGE